MEIELKVESCRADSFSFVPGRTLVSYFACRVVSILNDPAQTFRLEGAVPMWLKGSERREEGRKGTKNSHLVLVQLFPIRMDWMELEKIKNFDLFEI
jgi:hypothetical protein